MQRTICGFTACKYNDSIDEADAENGLCLYNGYVSLVTVKDANKDERLDCKNFCRRGNEDK